jgi:hypothetical protein
VVALDLDRRGAIRGVHDRLQLLGHAHLEALRRGLDVPVAERLVEQLVYGVAGRLADSVIGGVRLGVVVRRHLQVATCLQVDVTELDPPPTGLLPLLPAGGDRLDQGLGVEQVAPHPGQRSEQRLRHFITEATTTTSRSATRARGMTRRRWRGFTPAV